LNYSANIQSDKQANVRENITSQKVAEVVKSPTQLRLSSLGADIIIFSRGKYR